MREDERTRALERAKAVIASKAEDEKKLQGKAKRSFLPAPLYWLANLGTASGLPPFASIIIFLQLGILFVPESVWTLLGLYGNVLVLKFPKFIQYFVLNSTFPNSMFMFWFIAPFTLVVNTVLCFVHIHIRGFQDFLKRRSAKLAALGKDTDTTFVIQLLIFIALYAWMVFGNLGPPRFLHGFVPLKNRTAMSIFHGIQISLVVPAILTLITAELRASLIKYHPA